MLVVKRDGRECEFNSNKIVNAIKNANKDTNEMTDDDVSRVANFVIQQSKKYTRAINVEEIQDLVENSLMKSKFYNTAREYICYRYQKALDRKQNTTDSQILTTVNLENEEVKQENSNKNPTILSTQRDYIAGLVSKDITNRYLLPKDIQEAHNNGLIHFHDADYFVQKETNCCLWNLDDVLQNGTVINGIHIDKPHSFLTACTIATQIMAIVASSQYGGQTVTLSHLAPFVDVSRQRIRKQLLNELSEKLNDNDINKLIESRVKEEIKNGVQTIQYQILTLNSTNGQAPFVSLCMYLNEVEDEQTKNDLALIIEEVLKQRIQGIKNEKGVWITPAFPKLLYVLEEDNINKDSKYYYLTELAAKCTAKRMVPDYISEKVMKELKVSSRGTHDCYPCMGCRSFLTPDRFSDRVGNIAKAQNYNKDKPIYYSRFNQGVVTVNLVDIALSSKKNMDKFWKVFDERMDLCHRALRIRHERLLGTPSDVAPILWQYGALARLDKGETIDKLLYNGYSTLSLGYAGLWECVYYLTGKKLTEVEGQELGLQIMQKLNDYANQWKEKENIDYSLYGTPLESTTYKFAKKLQERFGIIKGVTDKNYITNSYHIHVTEEIDAFSKLATESKFQRLSPGGAISYVEVPNMTSNIEAVLAIIRFIYDNIMYAELNTKSDYCQCCGYDGQISIQEDSNGKLIWVCPQCGNKDQSKMNIARRTCGRQLSSNIATYQNDRNSREALNGNLEPSLMTNNNYKTCDVCGRHQKHIVSYCGKHLCDKHYKQIKKHGHVLDNNPRTIYDKNNYTIVGNCVYIDLYNSSCDVVAQAIIDLEDLNKVKHIKWRLNSNGYAVNNSKFKGSTTFLHRVVLNTNSIIDHINHNVLDNRKCNLRIVTHSQNQMNCNYKGVSSTNNKKYYAHIKLHQKMINLGTYLDESEALYARWKAEELLFKEYRYKKEEPQILPRRKKEIDEYVIKKVQRL